MACLDIVLTHTNCPTCFSVASNENTRTTKTQRSGVHLGRFDSCCEGLQIYDTDNHRPFGAKVQGRGQTRHPSRKATWCKVQRKMLVQERFDLEVALELLPHKACDTAMRFQLQGRSSFEVGCETLASLSDTAQGDCGASER